MNHIKSYKSKNTSEPLPRFNMIELTDEERDEKDENKDKDKEKNESSSFKFIVYIRDYFTLKK